MRKRVLSILAFLACMLLFTPAALAEEIKVGVTASPTELSDSGTVAFTFVISNYSDYELSNVTISYQGTGYEILKEQVIPMNGEARDVVLNLPVSGAQLGAPIVFTVSCIRNGEVISQAAEVTIGKASDPVISVERSASATTVKQGDHVKLTYALKNETKFDMTDITLIDENISDNPIVKLEKLLAGATYSFDYDYVMGTDSVVSTPFATYTVNGKTRTFSAIEPLNLTMVLVKLELRVTAGVPTSSGVTFTLDLKNTGTQDVNGIQITDERGNRVNEASLSLKPGDAASYTYQVVPVMTEAVRNVGFELTGTDALGAPYALSTVETYEVYPYVDESQIRIALVAETVTPWSSESGKVAARIIIQNNSTVELKNAVLSESATGTTLMTYDVLPAGETTFDQEIALGSPKNLEFSLKAQDPTGAQRTLGTAGLPIAYGTEAATAEITTTPSPVAENNMGAFNVLSSTISRILVILGVLMVIAFAVLIALSIMERNRAGRLRFDLIAPDDEADDDEDELDAFFESTPPRGYRDDPYASAAEEATYRQRIKDATMRQRAPSEPIPLPAQTASAGNAVHIEYEDSFEGQRAYSPMKHPESGDASAAGDTRRIRTEPIDAQPEPVRREPEKTPAARNEQRKKRVVVPIYYELDDLEGGASGERRAPKVIENKAKPAVRPQNRNVVRHVHAPGHDQTKEEK